MITPNRTSVSQNAVSSFYLHFPYCKHLCNYCDFYKLQLEDNQRSLNLTRFENYLDKSFKVVLDLLSRNECYLVPLETIYFGGGTPSLWSRDGINFLGKWFKQNNITFAENYEWTLEVDPGTTTEEEITLWRSIGVNRFSVGVQTFNEKIFPLMDRSHQLEAVEKTLKILSKSKLNFSVDFMLGLPRSLEFERNIIEELDKIMQFKPKHISLYFLTVPKNYRHYENLPEDDWIVSEYHKVVQYLTDLGFSHYEVASFALPGFESKHNQRYWDHSSVMALGPSATGFLKLKNQAQRYKWSTKWGDNTDPVYALEVLTESELELEKIYLTLRKGEGFNLADLGLEINQTTEIFHRWQKLNYCQVIAKKWKMGPSGWLILDTLVQELLTLKN